MEEWIWTTFATRTCFDISSCMQKCISIAKLDDVLATWNIGPAGRATNNCIGCPHTTVQRGSLWEEWKPFYDSICFSEPCSNYPFLTRVNKLQSLHIHTHSRPLRVTVWTRLWKTGPCVIAIPVLTQWNDALLSGRSRVNTLIDQFAPSDVVPKQILSPCKLCRTENGAGTSPLQS